MDTTPTRHILAIESGGSGTRVALADATGAILHQERCGSGSALYRDPDAFAGALSEAINRVLPAPGPPRDALAVVGLAGPMDHDLVTPLLDRLLPEVPRRTCTEGDIARGLYDLRLGVALVAGTGCSCSAVDENGRLTALGGYGPQFGDEGSACWIGREGLKAAFLAEQGRIEPTTLLDAARAFYRVDSPWEIHREAAGTGYVPAPRIAAFAPEVDKAAEGRDARAMTILDEAGAHLGRLILETAQQAHLHTVPVPLVMTGGTLRSKRVVSAIERALAEGPVEFAHHPIVHEPIRGLVRLLQRDNERRTLDDVS